jgi:TonB family protein
MSAFESWILAYLVNSLWQVPLVFLAAWVAARLVRPAGPHMEHRVWGTALLLQTALPACSLSLGELWRGLLRVLQWASAGAANSGNTHVALGPASPGATPLFLPPVLLVAITVAYLCSILYFAARLSWALFKTRELRCQASHIPLSRETATQWSRYAGLLQVDSHAACIVTSPNVSGPVTIGIRQSVLLLPIGFLERVSPTDLEAVFAHECAHMHRRDFARNLLYRALSLPVAYHPLLWLTGSRLAETREMLCDQMAAEAVAGPDRYARSLLRLASLLPARMPAVTLHAIGFFDANIFERRIMSLTQKRMPLRTAQRFALAVACGVVALATCASALALHMEVSTPATPAPAANPLHAVAVKVTALKILTKVPPVYPVEAKANKDTLDGPVVLVLIVGKDGVVENIRVSKSLRSDYDRSALDAVRQWRFQPFLLNGNPVEVKTDVTVTFYLGG